MYPLLEKLFRRGGAAWLVLLLLVCVLQIHRFDVKDNHSRQDERASRVKRQNVDNGNGGDMGDNAGGDSGDDDDNQVACQAYGDPHFLTFDGELLHYQGYGTYTLAQTCPDSVSNRLRFFNVETQLAPRGNPLVTRINEVNVTVFDVNVVFKRNKRGRNKKIVFIDDQRVTPPADPHPDVQVRLSGKYVMLEVDFGVKVSFDGRGRVMVNVARKFRGATCGICGNYNLNGTDDYLTPDGTLAENMDALGDSWRVQ